MKSKKLISFLCAAAMTVSSFAGLAVTASAATTDDILWSDTFNSYDLSGISYGTWLDNKLVSGEGSGSKTYSGIDGIVLYTGTKPEGDDSTYWALGSDTDGDKYLVTSTGRFTTVNRGAKLLFGSLDSSDALEATEFAATETKDVVLNLKVKGKAAWESANTYDNAFTIVGKDGTNEVETLFDMTTLGLDLNTWYNVKAVVTTAGTSIYVNNGTEPVATSTAKSITGLKFSVYINGAQGASGQEYRNSGNAEAGTVAGNGMGYPSYNLDDIVVFNADAGTGATTEVPAAQTHGAAVVTYETVPAGEAPSGLGLVASDDFNSMNSARLVFINTTEADSTYTDLDSVDIFCGTDSSTHSETKWSVTQNAKTDPALGTEKYLEAASNVKSAANRGPKFYFKRDGAILEVAEREKVVAQFAAKLHNNGDQPAEILFSGDLVASESKGNINSPLALITTDADAASAAYSCDNPLTKNGDNVIEVANNTWVLVEIEAYRSEGKTTGAKIKVTTYTDGEANDPVYILGSASSYGDIKDSTKSGVNNLPYVSFRSGNSTDYYGDGSGSNTTNDIDNIAIYSSTVDPAATPTPTPVPQHTVTIAKDGTVSTDETTAFDAVLIHAKYDAATKAPTSVKTYPLTGISATTPQKPATIDPAIAAGDKLFVWSDMSGIVPYGSLTVPDKTNISSTATITIPETGTVGTAITPTVTATGLTDDDFTYAWYKGDTAINVTTKAYTPDSAGTYKVVATVKDTNEDYTGEITSGNCVVTVPTYTVTGTLGTGVASAVLRPAGATDATKDVAGTVDGTTVTYTVPAGTYKVVATAASGYKTPVADPTTVTVDKDHTTASFNTSATKIISVTGTVDTGVAAVKLTEKQEAGATDDPVVYNGVINNGAVTFSDIAAGTYTIGVTLKDGYKDAVIKLGEEAATEVTVAAADITNLAVTSTDSALYRLNTTGVTNGQISYTLAFDDVADKAGYKPTNEEVALCNVPDFGTATTKTAAVPALDGWGYKHLANQSAGIRDSKGNVARQTAATVDTNAVYVNGDGGASGVGAISFIPANATLNGTLPATGTLVYTFTGVVTTTAGNDATKKPLFGITKSADGSTVDSVDYVEPMAASGVANQAVTKPIVIKYSLDKKYYLIYVDGELAKSGLSEDVPTGIYVQAVNAYNKAGIKDLIVTVEDNENAVFLDTIEETDGTIAVDKYIAEAGEKITITATPAAGKKVTAVTATPAGGEAITATAVEGQANKYEFTVPAGNDKDITVSATFGVADAATVTVAGGANAVTKGQSTPAFTATVKSADNTDITASKTVTWAVVGVPAEEGGTAPAVAEGTAVANGVLTVAAGETNTKLKVTATVDGVTGESGEITVSSTPTATVTVGTLSNGTVTINGDSDTTSTVDQGSTVTLTVTPATGYSIGTVSYVTASALEADPDAAGTAITPASGVYSFTMPNENVTVKATFTQNSYTITNNTGDAATAHGSVTVAASAHYNEEVTVTVTPAEGYELATLKYAGTATAETAITKDAESGAYKFTMPAENVTVTATFKVEVMEYTGATLLHTASATWGSNSAQTAKDQVKEHLNNDSGNGWAGSAFMQFTLPEMTAAEAAAIVYAPVTFSLYQGKGYDVAIYYLTSNPDWSAEGAIPAQDSSSRYTSSRTYLTTVKSPAANTNGTFTIDIAKAINEMGATGTVTLMLTGNGGGSDLYGKASTDPAAPVLGTLKKGRTVTFTSSVTDEDFDVVVTGDNIVGNKTVTVTGGTGSVTLPEGSYNYSVAAQNGYKAIASTALTVAKTPVTQPLNLELIPLSDVTFASNATNFTVVVKKGETTVEPKEAGGKVYSLIQGEEYTYTVTPTDTDAAAYDPKTATYTVTTDVTQTVTATLDAKTYSVTLTGLPQYAKVSYKVGDAADATDVYTDASGTLAAITSVPANAVITYTVEKGGYTTITDATTSAITADTNVPVTMTPTTANTVFYEDFGTVSDTSKHVLGFDENLGGTTPGNVETTLDAGSLKCYINGNGGRSIYAPLTTVTGYNTYNIKYSFGNVSAGTNKNADQKNTFSFLDTNNKEVFGTYVTQNNGTVMDYGYTVNGTSVSLQSTKAMAAADTVAVDVTVNITTKAVTGTVNGKDIKGTLDAETVNTIAKILISGNKYSVWHMDNFSIVGLDPVTP